MGIKQCKHCGTTVLPMADGGCPNCRKALEDSPVVQTGQTHSVNNSKYWQCPKCTGVLEKGFHGAAIVIGAATCSYCGAQYSQGEVYDGKWDVEILDGGIKHIGYGFEELDKKCFIATACYGSNDVYDVKLLREYRDRVLLTNKCGRVFVNAYYHCSPPVANFIRTRKKLRNAIRDIIFKNVVQHVKKKLMGALDKENI